MSWTLLVLPAVSLAPKLSQWIFGVFKWIDGKAYFVRFTAPFDPSIIFLCRPDRGLDCWESEVPEMRVGIWWSERRTAEMIQIRVDDWPPRNRVGVVLVRLERGDGDWLSTGFKPDGKSMQRILRGNTLVHQLGSTDGTSAIDL